MMSTGRKTDRQTSLSLVHSSSFFLIPCLSSCLLFCLACHLSNPPPACQDCFGDGPQPTDTTIPAYAPDSVVSDNCFGKESCFIGNFYNFDATGGDVANGTWAACTNSSTASCTKDLTSTAKLDQGLSKFKGLMMCA